ncbi:hypothetical protein VIGAN_10008200, partial [Vigna angularis var. angularis]
SKRCSSSTNFLISIANVVLPQPPIPYNPIMETSLFFTASSSCSKADCLLSKFMHFSERMSRVSEGSVALRSNDT